MSDNEEEVLAAGFAEVEHRAAAGRVRSTRGAAITARRLASGSGIPHTTLGSALLAPAYVASLWGAAPRT